MLPWRQAPSERQAISLCFSMTRGPRAGMPPRQEAWCKWRSCPRTALLGETIRLLSGGDNAGRDAHRDTAEKREQIYVFTALSTIYKALFFSFFLRNKRKLCLRDMRQLPIQDGLGISSSNSEMISTFSGLLKWVSLLHCHPHVDYALSKLSAIQKANQYFLRKSLKLMKPCISQTDLLLSSL